jgi:hypothetical protein
MEARFLGREFEDQTGLIPKLAFGHNTVPVPAISFLQGIFNRM